LSYFGLHGTSDAEGNGRKGRGGGGYAEFNVPFPFNRLPFHFMIGLIPKFVNAVGKRKRERKRERDTTLVK
jgi:hypothetical protein